MANMKKLLQAAAGASAGADAATNVEDVFATYTYQGSGNLANFANEVAIGDAYSLFFFGSDTGNSSNYGTSTTGWTTLIDLANQSTPDVNFFLAVYAVDSSSDETVAVTTSNANADPSYAFFNAVDFSYRKHAHGSGTVELNNLAKNSVVFLIEASDDPQDTYTAPSGFTNLVLENTDSNGTTATIAVSYQEFEGGSVSTSGGTFGTGNVYRALVEVSAPTGTTASYQQSSDSLNGQSSFNAQSHITTAPTGVGEGGLVWIKNRDNTAIHNLHDTARGAGTYLQTHLSDAEVTDADELVSFNSNGFTLDDGTKSNSTDGSDYVSWTFRKAEKFFDVLTYTGTGSATSVSHNLNHDVGMVMIKKTNSASNWRVWHRGLGGTNYLTLNSNGASASSAQIFSSAPTSTQINIGASSSVNASGDTYVAYIFAHNDGDAEFGIDGDADIIKCGSYTGNGSNQDIDVGFEPQWLLLRSTSNSRDWYIFDAMRGFGAYDGSDTNHKFIRPNENNAESDFDLISVNANGFSLHGASNLGNNNGETIIYIAIRRGPMGLPTDGSQVFQTLTYDGSGASATRDTDIQVDAFLTQRTTSGQPYAVDRLRGGTKYIRTNSTAAEGIQTSAVTDFGPNFLKMGSGAIVNSSSSSYCLSMWKRSHGFFDTVEYDGNGTSGRTVTHNLGVVPEMIWVKNRDVTTDNWIVYHSGVHSTAPEDYALFLNLTNDRSNQAGWWNDTAPTSSVFTVGNASNGPNVSGESFIAWLFASVDGVSKVGSYTGDGTSNRTIDCGFSNGARMVIIKKASANGAWRLFDSVRGIVAGNDGFMEINDSGAETTGFDMIDPHSSGFIATDTNLNADGVDYVFYAVAL